MDETINVLCLFCQSPLTAEEDKEFETGDLIKCNSCGKFNDYDSVIDVAIEEVEEQVTKELDKTINNMFK